MEFKKFCNAFMRVPCQIVRPGGGCVPAAGLEPLATRLLAWGGRDAASAPDAGTMAHGSRGTDAPIHRGRRTKRGDRRWSRKFGNA